MTGKVLFVAAVLLATPLTAVNAQNIVLSDSTPPTKSSQIYTANCTGGQNYTLKLAIASKQDTKLSIRHGGKIDAVNSPTLLATIGGADLYAVHMACTSRGAVFATSLVKPGGKLMAQSLIVDDLSDSVIVSPTTLLVSDK